MPLIGKEIRPGCCFTSQDDTGWSWLWQVMSSKWQLECVKKRSSLLSADIKRRNAALGMEKISVHSRERGKCREDKVPSTWNVHWLLLLLLSRFSRVRLCATPQKAAHQAPLSLGFCGALHRDSWGLTKPHHFLSVCEGGKRHSSYFFSSGFILRCHAAKS